MKSKTLKNLFLILYRLHILSPKGLFYWAKYLLSEGMSLMALLRFSAHFYPNRCAVKDEEQSLTYQETYEKAKTLAQLLYTQYQLRPKMSVALLGRNSLILSLLLPALSRIGAHITLLNTDMPQDQLLEYLRKRHYQLFIYDKELIEEPQLLACKAIITEELHHLIIYRDHHEEKQKLPRMRRGRNIIIHTGGSSGNYKAVSRRTAIASFLPPLIALLHKIGIDQYDSVLISLPFYHGFGLATLIVSLLMGKKICLQRRFLVQETLSIIQNERIEVMPIVPAMLSRLWLVEGAKSQMESLKCLICGGDRLPKQLIETTHQQLGDVLYNLYGTSEAGFFLLATPQELAAFDETTLGKAIWGVRCKIKEANEEHVGELWVRSSWAMAGRKNQWQSTGDLVFQNLDGYYFHRGRTDRMVVCGGENVHPEHIEQVLLAHPSIIAVRVFAVPHPFFGNVIQAEVECSSPSSLTEKELLAWLKPQLSRAETPHGITFQTIGMLSTGKQKRRKI